MAPRLTSDRAIQGFTPLRIQAITADSEWTPGSSDLAFRVSETCNYYINDESDDEGTLLAGSVTVIPPGDFAYTFDTTMKIEVM